MKNKFATSKEFDNVDTDINGGKLSAKEASEVAEIIRKHRESPEGKRMRKYKLGGKV